MRSQILVRNIRFAAVVAAALASGATTLAQSSNRWIATTSGKWETAASWSLGAPNITQPAAFVTNTTSKTITINSLTPVASMSISNLTLSAPSGSVNTLQMTNAPGGTPFRIVNSFTISSGGAMIVTNSMLQVDGVQVGGRTAVSAFTINGTFDLRSGQVTATNLATRVAFSGSGSAIVRSGLMLGGSVFVGYLAGSQGTLTVAGGTNSLVSAFLPSLTVGKETSATGTVWVTAGLLGGPEVMAYIGQKGVGRMTVSNGTVRVKDLQLGPSTGSRGTLTMVAGTVAVGLQMTVGKQDCTGLGVVTMTGGSLLVTNSNKNAKMLVENGTFTMSGGQLWVDQLWVTNACAKFVSSSGMVMIDALFFDNDGDIDGDGLPNGWEVDMGLDPLNPTGDNGATGDPDNDGLTNLQEYQLGTDPKDPTSPYRITSIAREGTDIRVTWTTVGGKTNMLQATSGNGGQYSDSFVDLPPQIIVTGSGITSTNRVEAGGANQPARYYRVRVKNP